ncbi:hypothetical protein QTP70_018749, partial [Hemibagrus guttatus]
SSHSTETADQGSPSLLILLYHTAMFDTVDHKIRFYFTIYSIQLDFLALLWSGLGPISQIELRMWPLGMPNHDPTQLFVVCHTAIRPTVKLPVF